MRWFGFHTRYAKWEHYAMRLSFAVLVFWTLQIPPVAAAPHPHSVARFVDLTFLADPYTFHTLRAFMLVPLALFVWGRWTSVSLTYILALWTGVWALIQSQGSIGHGSQIVGLVLVALWLAYTVGPWLQRRAGGWWRGGFTVHDLAVYWVYQTIAAGYVVSGISKLTQSGFQLAPLVPRWVLDVQYVSIQVAKTHEEAYYGALAPGLLERADLLGGFFASHPDLTRLFFTGGLVVELAAFLLLVNRRWALRVGVSLIMLHVMIGVTMNLRFALNIAVLLIFLVNVPHLVVTWARKIRWPVSPRRVPAPVR